MNSVDEIARSILRREGGFVNDPDDPGGATKYGVSVHTMARLGLDLNKDGQVDAQDVRQLSENQAVTIFKEHYFDRPRIGELPQGLRPSVFDMYVNAGGNAVRILQRLLAQFNEQVIADGVLGVKTLQAAKRVARVAPGHLVDAYGIARRNYYYRLADARPALRKFARRRDGGKGGWITRAEAFMSPKYHLSLRDHKRRCAKWG